MKAGTTGVLLAAVLACSAAQAQASTTIGQAPPTAGTLVPTCDTMGLGAEGVQLSNESGNSYGVPAGGGVITSWSSTITGDAIIRLRVYSADSNASTITPVAESAAVSTTPSGTGQQPTRIPVSGGERIGFAFRSGQSPGCISMNTPSPLDLTVGASVGPVGSPEPALPGSTNVLLNIAAVLEPDADRDGYGDETQDKCPGEAGQFDGCPGLQLGKPKADRKKGTATIIATVAGPGNVSLVGKNIRSQVQQVAAAGDVPLVLKAKGMLKSKLKKAGKATANVTITFTPANGEPVTETASVKLKKAKKKRN